VGRRLGSETAVGPGKMKAFEVEGNAVTVANVGGHFYAFDDACTHQRCSLADGDLDGPIVECECHGSRFDVRTGEVVRGPAPSPVRTYPVVVEGPDLILA
jgi:3-phenylpropionate/trans-cinnamate dioxygenase ferredoxin subunit